MTDLPIGLILLASQETSLLTLDTFMGLESCAADPQNQCLRRLRMPAGTYVTSTSHCTRDFRSFSALVTNFI